MNHRFQPIINIATSTVVIAFSCAVVGKVPDYGCRRCRAIWGDCRVDIMVQIGTSINTGGSTGNNGAADMNRTTPSLNLLRPEQAFILKWLSDDERSRLIRLVLDMTPAQYCLVRYGWGIGDGKN